MAKPDHIADLERRHKALEKETAEALTRTSSDDLMIADLKRRILHLRDELEWLHYCRRWSRAVFIDAAEEPRSTAAYL